MALATFKSDGESIRTKFSFNFLQSFSPKRDGYEFRILQVLGQRLNFTFDIGEPKNLAQLG